MDSMQPITPQQPNSPMAQQPLNEKPARGMLIIVLLLIILLGLAGFAYWHFAPSFKTEEVQVPGQAQQNTVPPATNDTASLNQELQNINNTDVDVQFKDVDQGIKSL